MSPVRDVGRSAIALVVLITVSRAFAAEPGCPLASFDARQSLADDLVKQFDQQGFDTQRGAMWVFTHADIEPDCQDCSHANPSSTYGCAMLVRPGQPVVSVTLHERRRNNNLSFLEKTKLTKLPFFFCSSP